MRKFFLAGILVVFVLLSHASSKTYYLNIFASGGYARFITDMDLSGIDKNGLATSFRIMWQPEHLLRIGLESGYNYLYSYEENGIETEFGTTDAKSSLSSIPVFFVMAMQLSSAIDISAGLGPSFLKTSFESFDWQTKSTQISTSYYVACSYKQPLSKKILLGGELRFYRIHKIDDSTLSLQLTIGYRLLSW